MFRVAIIGCGGIAQVHASVLHQNPETELIACADIRMERAQAMAEKYGCRAYASLEELLANEAPDAVHLCTPHSLHTPMAEVLAEKGIPVFTEKPPVIDRDQWARLQEAAKKIPLGICFQNRYNPNVKEAEKIIATGEFGELLGARAFVTWHRTESYYLDSGWRGVWETEGGGALINQSIHTLDLLVRLMGKADQVEAYMANHHLAGKIEVEDTVEAYLKLGGKTALFYATTGYVGNSPVLIELQFENAVVRLESDEMEIRTQAGKETRSFDINATLGKNYWGNGHMACISDFYNSLAEKRPFQNDIASVENTVEVMLQMYEQGKKYLKA